MRTRKMQKILGLVGGKKINEQSIIVPQYIYISRH